jgi:hypothetical protein
MIYQGHIENGHVVLDEPVALPDGAQVSVHIREEPKQADEEARIRALFGSISSGDARSADNARIDEDLARVYGANT